MEQIDLSAPMHTGCPMHSVFRPQPSHRLSVLLFDMHECAVAMNIDNFADHEYRIVPFHKTQSEITAQHLQKQYGGGRGEGRGRKAVGGELCSWCVTGTAGLESQATVVRTLLQRWRKETLTFDNFLFPLNSHSYPCAVITIAGNSL